MNEKQLSARDVALLLVGAVVLGGPAMAMVELEMLPGRWLNAIQDQLFGYHISAVSFGVLMLVEILLIGALVMSVARVIRRATGKTMIELLQRNR